MMPPSPIFPKCYDPQYIWDPAPFEKTASPFTLFPYQSLSEAFDSPFPADPTIYILPKHPFKIGRNFQSIG